MQFRGKLFLADSWINYLSNGGGDGIFLISKVFAMGSPKLKNPEKSAIFFKMSIFMYGPILCGSIISG
jgi:hypothetical protein